MNTFKLDKIFTDILSMPNINHFSAVEIRTAYIAIIQDEKLVPASVRRFVYEELLKLVKKGWLKKQTSNKKGVTRYIKTNLFEYDYFKALTESGVEKDGVEGCELNYYQTLTTRLKEHNVELLEGLGELELYLTLWEKHPTKKNNLKAKYIATQENNHILKGKINGLGELLKHIKDK
jgi:hypothetical protein